MDGTYEINDDYDHLDDNLEYILENVLSEETHHDITDNIERGKLKELFNTVLINRCDCDDISQCFTCLHGVNYTLDEKFQELVINAENKKGDLIYECNAMCKCSPERCLNRLVQYGPRKYLKIVDSPKYHSKGVITTKDVPKGAFICEYAGELLTKFEAKKILRDNEINHKMNYMLSLREAGFNNLIGNNDDANIILTFVDPSKKGNIGRYLNHSCQPNCRIFSVRIDCPIPKIAIFSGRHILAGEELCFHYNEGIECENLETVSTNQRIPCRCGTQSCKKYLPNFE